MMARTLTRVMAVTAIVAAVAACSPRHIRVGHRVVVLGVDGLDYGLVRELIARGRLPHFAQLAGVGGLSPLETTIPPQSPVAWSSFITGLDPGGHQIFDFIHRDAASMEPYLSTTRVVSGQQSFSLGRWRVPMEAPRIELLRRGEPFWSVAEGHRVMTSILRMPANFPPSGTASAELSGMGTPDILGTYGTFTFFTSHPQESAASVSGGTIVRVTVEAGTVRSAIEGPENPYLVGQPRTAIPFVAYVDSRREYLKLVVDGQEALLHVGNWSDWIAVDIGLAPGRSVKGECRFYLKGLAPDFELYASPVNLDPAEPAMPLSNPPQFAGELARATGRFYTQGMPADTKALRAHVLSRGEFLAQAGLTRDESLRLYRYALSRFDDGLLFFYFGHVDQVSHMFWRTLDPTHPAYSASDRADEHVIPDEYVRIDALVGETLDRLGPSDLLVVMSDHGFASWRRTFSLNSWLRDHGYLALREHRSASEQGPFADIDWGRTRAYGLGLNGLYINVRGREAVGVVPSDRRESLAEEIAERLRHEIDPATGAPIATTVFVADHSYKDGTRSAITPDLIVGYAKGTRVSDESATGGVPREVLADNLDEWSGDHCMDPQTVPGILLVSRSLRQPARSLQTLGSALLRELNAD